MVYREGDEPKMVYIIRSGEFKVKLTLMTNLIQFIPRFQNSPFIVVMESYPLLNSPPSLASQGEESTSLSWAQRRFSGKKRSFTDLKNATILLLVIR